MRILNIHSSLPVNEQFDGNSIKIELVLINYCNFVMLGMIRDK